MPDPGVERGFTTETIGESLLLLRFGTRIDAGINARVHAAAAALHAADLPGLIDLVPAYTTLGVVYDPVLWADRSLPPWRRFAAAVETVLSHRPELPPTKALTVDIPVLYDGPDLADVAQRCQLDPDETIHRHAGGHYSVAMIGFAPGFAYLLGLDPSLHAPRRSSPRLRVPAGSVAIGGAQTGIYPSELPGGWNLIGRTPLCLFDAGRASPCLLAPGNRVRFRAIDAEEFSALHSPDPP